jgi:hypothetical protein
MLLRVTEHLPGKCEAMSSNLSTALLPAKSAAEAQNAGYHMPKLSKHTAK